LRYPTEGHAEAVGFSPPHASGNSGSSARDTVPSCEGEDGSANMPSVYKMSSLVQTTSAEKEQQISPIVFSATNTLKGTAKL